MLKNNGHYVSGKFTQRKKNVFIVSHGLVSNKVNCVLLDNNGVLLAGTEKGLCKKVDDKFVPVFKEELNKNIADLAMLNDGTVAVSSLNKLYFVKDGVARLARTFDADVVQVCDKRGFLWILTKERFICTSYDCKTDDINRPLEGGEGQCVAVSDTQVYVGTQTNISIIHGKRKEWKNILPMFSSMPKKTVSALSIDDAGYLWVGSEEGVAIHDNGSLWLDSDKIHTLPKNPVYKIRTDKVGGRYFATDVGVVYQKNGGLKYFSAERWVPDNKVNDIAVTDDGSVFYAATDKGIAEITAYETTLAEKEKIFEELVEKYHIRRGYTAAKITEDDDIDKGFVQISDNDGLWTAMYVAAQSFRYAATGDIDALEKARRGLKAMLFLTRITGIPGFTARAVRYPGEDGYGDGDHEWGPSDDGSCEWKGETSSDEMTGHFFGMSTYYDFCANDEEKEEIKVALCAIMDHIVRNNYRLVDRDGLPTTWAAWDPAMLNYDDKWFFERGINSFELLAFLKVCYHVSGDEKYNELYKTFVTKHHYPLNAMQHKIRDAHICHIDDNLGFLVTLTLLRLEENEALRAYYMCGLEDHWQYERVEKQPLFCFIHALFTGRDSDLVEGVQSLREMPLDLKCYFMENSKRKDIVYDTEQEEWHEDPLPLNPLPFDERNVHRADYSPFVLDSNNRDYVMDGTVFLLPYWIAKYYGLLKDSEE